MKKNPGIDIRLPKQRGEWAELQFMAKAAGLGFNLSRPFGDCTPYDVAIDLADHIVRVQVKSTFHRQFEPDSKNERRVFAVSLRPHARLHPYLVTDFEYLAIYVIPKDIWYIIPSVVALDRASIYMRPGDKKNKYERYREAWHLLHDRFADAPKGPRGFLIFGCAEEAGADL